jgi:hypothetical protein
MPEGKHVLFDSRWNEGPMGRVLDREAAAGIVERFTSLRLHDETAFGGSAMPKVVGEVVAVELVDSADGDWWQIQARVEWNGQPIEDQFAYSTISFGELDPETGDELPPAIIETALTANPIHPYEPIESEEERMTALEQQIWAAAFALSCMDKDAKASPVAYADEAVECWRERVRAGVDLGLAGAEGHVPMPEPSDGHDEEDS